MTIAELVRPIVTDGKIAYVGSITIDEDALDAAGILPCEMVYIDDADRQGPPWRTYTLAGTRGKGDIVNNGPPAYHFAEGDHVTIRAAAQIAYEDMAQVAGMHTKVFFKQAAGAPNRVIAPTHQLVLPPKHWRKMCTSKLHRARVTKASKNGPEALIVDGDILEAAGFQAGLEVQFTSLRDGVLRRTSMQAGPRGTGAVEVYGSGAWHIEVGTLLITLAEEWLPYEDAVKNTEPRVVFFDESITGRNVIRHEMTKVGWRPS
jgi:aspartate 1-decarboxylase